MIDKAISAASQVFGVPEDEITGGKRTDRATMARYVACWAAHTGGLTQAAISRAVTCHYKTVSLGVSTVDRIRYANPAFRATTDEVLARVGGEAVITVNPEKEDPKTATGCPHKLRTVDGWETAGHEEFRRKLYAGQGY